MTTVTVVTQMNAPPERCFDLARSAEVHVQSTAHTGERIVAGKTSGLFELGDVVMFEARHFAIRQRLTAQITEMDRPRHFQDRMLRGAFKSLHHDHLFQPKLGGTEMTDIVTFTAPGGWVGLLIERCVLRGYLRRFLQRRAAYLRDLAERA